MGIVNSRFFTVDEKRENAGKYLTTLEKQCWRSGVLFSSLVEQGVFCTNEISCRLLRALKGMSRFPSAAFISLLRHGQFSVSPGESVFPGAQSRQTSRCFFQLSRVVFTKGSSSEPGLRDPSVLVVSPRAEVTPWARLPPTRWGVALTPEDWGNEFQVQVGMGRKEEAGRRPWFVLLRPCGAFPEQTPSPSAVAPLWSSQITASQEYFLSSQMLKTTTKWEKLTHDWLPQTYRA